MSKEEFLNKLPKNITKNGKVIQIRAAIEDKLEGKKDVSVKNISERDVGKGGEKYEEDAEGVIVFKTPEVAEEELCCLKIRTESGQVCLLRLNCKDKMGDVYSWMGEVSKSKGSFKVFSNYPKREYLESDSQTL